MSSRMDAHDDSPTGSCPWSCMEDSMNGALCQECPLRVFRDLVSHWFLCDAFQNRIADAHKNTDGKGKR